MFVYLFVLFAVSVNLYFTEKLASDKFMKQMFLWFPAFIIYSIPLAFQYDVGTDYFAYYNNFYDGGHLLFFTKQEYIYYYLQEFVIFLGEPQLQFIFSSIIQSVLFFYILFILKKKGYNSFLLFFIFFLITGMYHNQMNGIRQYIAIYCFIVYCLLFLDKKYLQSLFFLVIGFYFHKSILIPLLYFIPFLFFKPVLLSKSFSYLVVIFFAGLLFHFFNWTFIVQSVLESLSLNYAHYLDSEYGEGRSIIGFLTKFYYTPLFLWFFIIFYKKKLDNYNVSLLMLWALTCFIYIQGIYFSLFIRTWAYFTFFMVFPVYYLMLHYKKNFLILFLIVLYMFIAYLLKISVFAVGEYDYNFYRGWF
ncbi:EpsG family protein [Acinetobacter haemolyticus]|uniref:EpsG family protein n=1 Tax=Acinetobacter haemolyticus TaxID=29430 RepID=UPI003AF9C83A